MRVDPKAQLFIVEVVYNGGCRYCRATLRLGEKMFFCEEEHFFGEEKWQERVRQIDVYSSMLGGRLAELTYWRIGIAGARRKACCR